MKTDDKELIELYRAAKVLWAIGRLDAKDRKELGEILAKFEEQNADFLNKMEAKTDD